MAQWAKSLLSKDEGLRLDSQKPHKTRHGSGCLQSQHPSTCAVRWGTRLGEAWELEGQLAYHVQRRTRRADVSKWIVRNQYLRLTFDLPQPHFPHNVKNPELHNEKK